ncbi:MAG: type II toxin-antitoxin system PemK/MazF family toxin [Bacteroidia bacterium]|nr:type II toxin-antitoxin system PemK/MazF family toxin [Bacteroidia bacterium]
MAYRQWDIAVVPFPFVDSPKTKPRPVLIISGTKFHRANNHCLAAMITTSSKMSWAGDTIIQDLKMAGLEKPSLVRLKLFTLDLRLAPRTIGRLCTAGRASFLANFNKYCIHIK